MNYKGKTYDRNIEFPLFIKCAAIDGNELWFMDIINNGLCYVDLSERTVKTVYKIPDTMLLGENKYYGIKIVKNKIVLFPYAARDILVFHKEQKEFKKIDLDVEEGSSISAGSVSGDMLFVFMLSAQKIVVINLLNEEIIENINFPLRQDAGEGDYRIQFSDGCAYMQNAQRTQILKFDMVQQSFEQQEMKDDNWQLMDGEGAGPYFLGDYGKLARWDWSQGTIQEFSQLPDDYKYYVFEDDMVQWKLYRDNKLGKNFLQKFYDDGQAIWFIPFSSEELVRIDKKTHETKKMIFASEEEKKTRAMVSWGKFFLCADVHRDFLWLYSLKRNMIYKINVEMFTYEEIKIFISRQDLFENIGGYFQEKKGNIENIHMGLSVYLEYLKTLA